MNIVITGGLGFIGKHIANSLCNKHLVTVIDNGHRASSTILSSNIRVQHIDLLTDEISINGADTVIHLAALVGGIQYYIDNAFEVMASNTRIDLKVIDAARRAGVKKFIYASSAHIYPNVSHIMHEDTIGHPVLSYGWAKLYGEQLVNSVKGFMNTSILRLIGVYGPGQDIGLNTGSLIPVMCRRAAEYPETEFLVRSTGNEKRSYVYIDDVVECIKTVLQYIDHDSIEPLNIGSATHIPVKDIVEMISSVSQKKPIPKFTNDKPLINDQNCSVAKAQSVLGWSATTDLATGLKNIYKDIEDRVKNNRSGSTQ